MLWRDDVAQDQGAYKVLLKRGEITDAARVNDDGTPRTVPFKVYYPAGADADQRRFPVILWSHGYGGSRDGAGFLARYVASFGYILVHLTHTGTDSSLWEGKPGHPWEILKKAHVSRTTTLNRYRDIPFVLDALPDWFAQNPDLGAIVDWSAIGMSGHSFGAITTQVSAGQLTPDEEGALTSLYDPRITSGITYSPVPGTSHLSGGADGENQGANIYATIKTPLLHMTGTEDSSPVNNMPYTERFKVYDLTEEADVKALLIKEGGDHMVYNGTRGALAANPMRDRHEDIIKHVSLAWWDAWLKGDALAQAWLKDEVVALYLGADAKWKAAG